MLGNAINARTNQVIIHRTNTVTGLLHIRFTIHLDEGMTKYSSRSYEKLSKTPLNQYILVKN